MTKEKNKAGKSSVLILMTILFLPAIFMLIFSKGCTSKFRVLDAYGKVGNFEFTDSKGNKLTNKDFEGKIVIYTTIQNECPNLDSCGINIWQIDQQIYQTIYENHQRSLGHVYIVSVVTDTKGNPTKITPELMFKLKDKVHNYDPKIWKIVEGSPQPIYDVERNNLNIYKKVDSSFLGHRMFLESLVLVDWNGKRRLVRYGKTESMIRDFHDGFTLLEKEYDNTIRNEEN